MLPVTTSKSELLEYIARFDVVEYARTRNHVRGGVSYLSPFITHGVVTLPEIRSIVLERYSYDQAEKFIQELAWREYFQKVFATKGDDIFSDLRFPRSDWKHHELVTAITTATTGIAAIDAAVAELYKTGYMHNHARLWVAMLACNVAKADWCEMSRWFYYHLIDGDVASNTLSWQWVAGTSVQKQYVANQDLINSWTGSKERGTYLDNPLEEVGSETIPTVLQPHTTLELTTMYQASDEIPDLAGKTVYLYTPYTLNPDWRRGEKGIKIVAIDPAWFDRFPVSQLVMDFIQTLIRTHLPTAVIYVGAVTEIPALASTTTIHTIAHTSTKKFPGRHDVLPDLFPQATGYYPSFFKFWQACLASR
jgi:deoxyribodipyrimidine photo-lyase